MYVNFVSEESFTTAKGLRNHKMAHRGEKPHKCDVSFYKLAQSLTGETSRCQINWVFTAFDHFSKWYFSKPRP